MLVTALLKAGSVTVSLSLEYRTTTSPWSWPNVAEARSAACWLSLFGAVKPPAVWSELNTLVPHSPAKATTATDRMRTRRR